MRKLGIVFLSFASCALAGVAPQLTGNTRQYLAGLVRRDTSNPPGNETRAANYLKEVADKWGIPCELLGDSPNRLNFIARLRGSGKERPLLLMSHTDVVPADRSQWTVDPFGALTRGGYIYGRGTLDTKGLLAAEMAILVELKRQGIPLKRDIILLAEADEEAGSTGIQWLIQNAWSKIDAEFALNETGSIWDLPSGVRLFQVQTAEKIPTRIVLTARGTAGHASLPVPDNAVVRVAKAVARLADSDQPVRINTTARRYLTELSKLPDYHWLSLELPKLMQPSTATAAANRIRARDPELDAMIRTSISPTMLSAGQKINVIPSIAKAWVDIRRVPDETREEVLARCRRIVNDLTVEVAPAGGQELPPTEPSSMTTSLYLDMAQIFQKSHPRAVVTPMMIRAATDGSFLRRKGMAVYGVPVFRREGMTNRSHGNDERISLEELDAGAQLLWKIVLKTAAANGSAR